MVEPSYVISFYFFFSLSLSDVLKFSSVLQVEPMDFKNSASPYDTSEFV